MGNIERNKIDKIQETEVYVKSDTFGNSYLFLKNDKDRHEKRMISKFYSLKKRHKIDDKKDLSNINEKENDFNSQLKKDERVEVFISAINKTNEYLFAKVYIYKGKWGKREVEEIGKRGKLVKNEIDAFIRSKRTHQFGVMIDNEKADETEIIKKAKKTLIDKYGYKKENIE